MRPYAGFVSGIVTVLAVAACGGGGGGSSPPPPAPTLTLTAGAASVVSGGATTLTWSTTNATACTASGAWDGSRATSGTESTGALTSNATFTLSCSGAGGNASASATVTVTAGPVTLSGTVTYARVPHDPASNSAGLVYQSTRQEPARGITVEIVNASTQAVLATTRTDGSGGWSTSVPGGTNLFVRARAQLLRTAAAGQPGWNVTVGDTEAALSSYAFDDAPFDSGPGGVRNVAIPSGWDPVTRLPVATRASAPFAILDSIYRGMQFVAGAAPGTDFPQLFVDWSPDNEGGTTFYTNEGGQSKIVLSGQMNVDIDEFDPHTILHEFGHYLEDRFSRSDNIGGPHAFGDRLDPRVAFGEGWGYAFAAMALNDPIVRDAGGSLQSGGSIFSVEQDSGANPGWFSEASVQEILWDLFDPLGEFTTDGVELGFAPLWALMTGDQRSTPAFTSVFSFITKLKERESGMQGPIDALVTAESITAAGMDIFGTTETHAPVTGGSQVSDVLPVYTPISIGGGPVTLRTTGLFDPNTDGNKLSVHRFLRLAVPAPQSVRITATPLVAGRDIDIYLVRSGAIAASGTTNSAEDFTTTLAAGDYVIDIVDCGLAQCGVPAVSGASDITVTIAPN